MIRGLCFHLELRFDPVLQLERKVSGTGYLLGHLAGSC